MTGTPRYPARRTEATGIRRPTTQDDRLSTAISASSWCKSPFAGTLAQLQADSRVYPPVQRARKHAMIHEFALVLDRERAQTELRALAVAGPDRLGHRGPAPSPGAPFPPAPPPRSLKITARLPPIGAAARSLVIKIAVSRSGCSVLAAGGCRDAMAGSLREGAGQVRECSPRLR
jgi:hypothetical protein